MSATADCEASELNESDLQLANLDLDTLVENFTKTENKQCQQSQDRVAIITSSQRIEQPISPRIALYRKEESQVTNGAPVFETKSPLCATRKRSYCAQRHQANANDGAPLLLDTNTKVAFTKTAILSTPCDLAGNLSRSCAQTGSFLTNLRAAMRDNSYMPNSLPGTQKSDSTALLNTQVREGDADETMESQSGSSLRKQTASLLNESFGLDSQRLARIMDVADQLHVDVATRRVELQSGAGTPFYGLPDTVRLLLAKERRISALYDWQTQCLMLEAVQRRSNLLYVLPTNGGKTLVAELIMLRTLLVHRLSVLFVLPFVSIVQEKIRSLVPFADALDFFLEEYAGGRGRLPPVKHRRPSLYVATIEKAHALLNSLIDAQRTGELGLLVVDEVHLLGESGSRGATLEEVITKVKLVNSLKAATASSNVVQATKSMYKVQSGSVGESKNASQLQQQCIQVVGMTATLANVDEVAMFLEAVTYTNAFRPTEIHEFVKVADSLYRIDLQQVRGRGQVSANERRATNMSRKPSAANTYNQLRFQRVVHHKYSSKADVERDVDRIVPLVAEVVPQHSCLVFCATKRACENVAMLLADLLPRRSLSEQDMTQTKRINLLKEMQLDANGSICPILRHTVPRGVAYHHGGLTHDERRALEDAFIAADGVLPVLVCTSTLAAGVNLPARRVIIRSPFVATDFLTQSRYRQIIGRAGRTGFETVGESIAVVSDRHLEQFIAMVTSPVEDCLSQLTIENGVCLYKMVLSLLGLKLANSFVELERVLSMTLFAVQARAARRSVDGGSNKLANLREMLADILVQLCNDRFLRVQDSDQEKPVQRDGNLAVEHGQDPVGKLTEREVVRHQCATTCSSPNSSEKLQPIRRCMIEQAVFECTKLGRAAFKSGIALRYAVPLSDSLAHALRALILDSDLHVLCVLTPFEDVEQVTQSFDVNETPFWQVLLTRLHAILNDAVLCDHTQRVCDAIGIHEQYIFKRAHGCVSSSKTRLPANAGSVITEPDLNGNIVVKKRKSVECLFSYKRFFLTLILFELWRGRSIFAVATCFSVSRGFVQNLLSSAASFASCVLRFVEEFDEFESYKKLLPDFARRLTYCTNQELIPLMQLAGVKQARASQLVRAGIRTVEDLAKLTEQELLAKQIENLSRRAAKQIIEAARLHLKQEAEELKEKAMDLMMFVQPRVDFIVPAMKETVASNS